MNYEHLKLDNRQNIYYIEDEVYVGEDKNKIEEGENSQPKIPDTEDLFILRIEDYLEKKGIHDSKEQYKDYKDKERIYKAKTKLENWRKSPKAKDILILSLRS
ncbi:hypothetical protein Ddye_007560 [Dipteronia dyeriana]|uniref:Uncharacterized protein n=1 Tax=Dipteronia dyeriana TaxID=168575 RepID=A0AAD9XKG5_9ROSI|nr:hypothetical protein Ddye_007560 [Dipteronia dyeriana]